jgi:hypothetical protein
MNPSTAACHVAREFASTAGDPPLVGSAPLAFLSIKSRIRGREVLLRDRLGATGEVLLDKQLMAARKRQR